MKPRIVCLCGSTRFMDAFFDVGWQETLEGRIVLSVGVCKHAADHGGEALGPHVAAMLDELHLRKIDLADEILVLNVGGYVGDSTRREIEYARKIEKPVRWLEQGPNGGPPNEMLYPHPFANLAPGSRPDRCNICLRPERDQIHIDHI